MEPDPVGREDPDLRDEHAGGAQRREPGQRRGRQDVARAPPRVRGPRPRRRAPHARPVVGRAAKAAVRRLRPSAHRYRFRRPRRIRVKT